MCLVKAFLAGLVTASLAACGGAAVPPASGVPPQAASSAPLAPSITAKVQDALRPAVTNFYSVSSAGKLAASWDLLAPATKKQIPLRIWVRVHEACPAAGRKPRVIKSVTVFGNAAIVTAVIPAAAGKAGVSEDVFNYANGHWGYSPEDIGIYEHRSIAADVAAAKAAGLCTGWKNF